MKRPDLPIPHEPIEPICNNPAYYEIFGTAQEKEIYKAHLGQIELPEADWTRELPDRLKQTLRMLYNEQMREERFREEMEEMRIF